MHVKDRAATRRAALLLSRHRSCQGMTQPTSATATSAATSSSSSGPSRAVMDTYARLNVVFERGEGSWLISTEGERYLDFGSGIAVNLLGHAHPTLVEALTEQATKLSHTSNLYRVAGRERLAERLCAAPFADRVFFCTSGVEAAIGPETAGILIEPVQGEGGIRVIPVEFLRQLRELCDRHGLLLVFDEVQCGMGRTGKVFAHEWAGITPDVMAIAKGIGGGF